MAPVINATFFSIFDTPIDTKILARRKGALQDPPSLRRRSVHVLTAVDRYVGAGYKRRFFG
jgi:hypothetical protein